MLTRMGSAKDWGAGIELKANMLGKLNKLEVHHIFPKAQLYKLKHARPEVNALANFCFQTKQTNLAISDRLPEEYFPEFEAKHPGVLASQWIPMDSELWKIQNYRDFLEARKELLATEANLRLAELLHGDTHWLQGDGRPKQPAVALTEGITSEAEEELEALNAWVESYGLPRGVLSFDFSDPATGEQQAIFDLAWPNGIQEELSEPVAVLLNETGETVALASSAGFRCFTSVAAFKNYLQSHILSSDVA